MTPIKKGRLKVEYVGIKRVKPAKGNTRAHPPEQIDEIVRQIQEIGWTKPIIVDERMEILAGHGARQAALQMGMPEVPIIMRTGLTQAQKRAYRIADNKIAEHSEWDLSLLGTELTALREMGFDMTLTGFKAGEIDALLRPSPGPASEPAIPERGPKVSCLGDLWLLGEHRLICGDSTKPATYLDLLNGHRARMVFVDPPYGISYEAPSGKFKAITGDALRRGQLTKMLHDAFAAAEQHVRQDAAWYVWHASATREDFSHAMRDIGLVELGYIFWAKPGMVLGWSDYRWAHEPCFYAAKQGTKPAYYGDRNEITTWKMTGRTNKTNQPHALIGRGIVVALPTGEELYITPAPPKGSKVRHVQLQPGETLNLSTLTEADNVWEVSRDNGHGKEESIHPTQKPVELARRAIRNSSREGEIVLDFFAGSGSTLMGAENTKRTCYAIELDPTYVDAIIRRWQNATGKQATHEKEGKTFEALTKARAGKAKPRAA